MTAESDNKTAAKCLRPTTRASSTGTRRRKRLTPKPLKPVVEVPGYTILSKIGEGSTAVVWRAQQQSLDRPVAIKILKKQHASDPAQVADFINEAKSIAQLRSRNIIQVYDVGEHDGAFYFVMELVSGRNVAQLLERNGPFAPKDALRIATGVAEALDEAWTSGHIFHRDIKPDNIILDQDQNVKVADLGLAGCIDAHGQSNVRDDEIAGTPHYMSPEQGHGGEALDYHTDMYSLGATLYHMVTGYIPFNDRDDEAVIAAQGQEQLVNPRDLNANVTNGCAKVIAKLMMKSPRSRYRSWAAAVTDLKKLSHGKIVVVKAPASAKSTIAPPTPTTATVGANGRRKPSVERRPRTGVTAAAPSTSGVPFGLRFLFEVGLLVWFVWLGYKLLYPVLRSLNI